MSEDAPQHTIANAYREICGGRAPWVALGNFMEDFFWHRAKRYRAKLLAEPIQEPAEPTTEQRQWAAFCAASVEYLCQKYDLPCPAWVNNPSYVLAEPWYHSPFAYKPHVRASLQEESPEAFAKRNIFCSNRVYANKYEFAEEMRQRQRQTA